MLKTDEWTCSFYNEVEEAKCQSSDYKWQARKYINPVWSCQKITRGQMLEGGVEEGRVVVWRRGAALIWLPIRQDWGLIAMETRDVTAHDGHLVISTLGKGEKPELKKTYYMLMKHKVSMQQYQSHNSWTRRAKLDVFTCWVFHSWCCCSPSCSSAPPMVEPCRCRSAHPKTQRIQMCMRFSLSLLSVCLDASGCEGVFLHQGCLGPCRLFPQKSEVWPYPSCNCTYWGDIQNASWKFLCFLNLFPEFSFSHSSLPFL